MKWETPIDSCESWRQMKSHDNAIRSQRGRSSTAQATIDKLELVTILKSYFPLFYKVLAIAKIQGHNSISDLRFAMKLWS